MTPRPRRTVGEHLSRAECDLLALLCAGEDAQSARAREQLRIARWGGYSFAECGCMLIAVDAHGDCPAIKHDGGPFSTLAVSRNGEDLGLVELWVVDGLLHSVDYMPFDGDHGPLPTVDEYDLKLDGIEPTGNRASGRGPRPSRRSPVSDESAMAMTAGTAPAGMTLYRALCWLRGEEHP